MANNLFEFIGKGKENGVRCPGEGVPGDREFRLQVEAARNDKRVIIVDDGLYYEPDFTRPDEAAAYRKTTASMRHRAAKLWRTADRMDYNAGIQMSGQESLEDLLNGY